MLAQVIINGLLQGGFYACIGVSFSIVFGIMRIMMKIAKIAKIATSVFGIVTLSGLFALAADPPKGKADAEDRAKAQVPATAPAFHLSEVIVKNVKARPDYLYVEAKTTIAKMSDTVKAHFEPLIDKMSKSQIMPRGGPVFVYADLTQDVDKEFTVRMGMPVEKGVKAPEGCKLAQLDGYKCASVYYTGSLQDIGKGYAKLYTDLFAQRLKPTGESREVVLYWEGPESENNVIEIQAAVK